MPQYSRSSSWSGLPPGRVRRSVSSRDDWTRRFDTLEVMGSQTQQQLDEHIAQTRQWQDSTSAQLGNISEQLQQQQSAWDAFFRSQGFDPRQHL